MSELKSFEAPADARREAPRFEIHEAQPEDAEQIADIQYASWLVTYPNAETGITIDDLKKKLGEPQSQRERWKKIVSEQKEGRRTFVIKDGDRVLGYCLAIKGETENRIHALYLDPKEVRRGIGSAIFSHALEWLGGDKSVKLEVASHNERAISFYERFGFQREGEEYFYELGEGKKLPSIDMRRPKSEPTP